MSLENFGLHQLQDLVLSGATRKEKWRRKQLHALSNLLENHQEEILNALRDDLQKPPTEAFFEILSLRQELQLYENQLSSWMKPQNIKVPLWLKPGEASVIAEPLGCVLIIEKDLAKGY